MRFSSFSQYSAALAVLGVCAAPAAQAQPPRVIIISLDGASPRFAEQYLSDGTLPANQGLGLLRSQGIFADQNLTITPSLTAPAHIAIATGANASANNINANAFHAIASPLFTAGNASGFAAPIGGYLFDGINPPSETPNPSAQPLWVNLRAAGKKVVTATWPGGDGLDVRLPGQSAVVQPAVPRRTVDYTVPFGAFGGIGATAFALVSSDFAPAPTATTTQLTAAGRTSFSPVRQKVTPLETPTVGGVSYLMQVAALDTTNDGTVNYDTLVFWDTTNGIRTGPFPLPDTGPAYVRQGSVAANVAQSQPFFFVNSSTRAGVRFYVTNLAPDLSVVRFVRTSANFIPRNLPVLSSVDDINTNVGFWQPQPDFRIVQRVGLGTAAAQFTDLELEAVYKDLVLTFTEYQANVTLRSIQQNPGADLVMTYFEQPDGSFHQYLLTDSRQPTNPADPGSIGAGQDAAKVARYAEYRRFAYQSVNTAIQRIIDQVGTGASGKPNSNLLVVSDHGFEPFHTAVDINTLLSSNGIPLTRARAVISGPAVNIYINLQGREPGGTVGKIEYLDLQQRIATLLRDTRDSNPAYTLTTAPSPVFSDVFARPADPNSPDFGRATTEILGQDAGDVFALLAPGYNFDGVQNIRRNGDAPTGPLVLTLPSFYGAHGYNPAFPNMSAIFYAAGPDIAPGRFAQVRNIDIAPTVSNLLGVASAATVQGQALNLSGTGAAQLQRAVSRKVHGALGSFDIPLAEVEPRRGAAGDTHQIVLTFSGTLDAGTAPTVTVPVGIATVAGTTFAGSELIVTLSGVADQQSVQIQVTGLRDARGIPLSSVTQSLRLLLGDADNNGLVNQADVDQVRTATAGAPNLRNDVVVSGAVNSSDIGLTRSR
ncbi:MAG: alkaline phosphatase family protein, partial [Cytophagales bacterium]|nr:alkaline phosphatase family protein [Armatimonadota bacterium]